MAKRQRYIISSTHIDSQGYMMAKSALESALPNLNGPRKVRLGLEHIKMFPPMGVSMNGEVIQGEDMEYYLVAENVYFDKQEVVRLADGTELFKESFEDGGFPFVECNLTPVDTLSFRTDPANYNDPKEVLEIRDFLLKETGMPIKQDFIGRKSQLSDPETIITITKMLAIALGLAKSKITEKIGEAIGEDLAKFYKFIAALAIETIKRAKPANRPKNFVIVYPNDECIIELIIVTHNHDDVVNALTMEKLKVVREKMELLVHLLPEKVQFVYSKTRQWNFNYLLSADGSTTGTYEAFNNRNLLYNQILIAQQERESGKAGK